MASAASGKERHSYVQLYPSDWKSGMSYMPPSVEWLYLQICLHNWDKAEPLPRSHMKLTFHRSPTWEEDLAILLETGKVLRTQGGGLFVRRALSEANRAKELWEAQSKAGRAGARNRGKTNKNNNDFNGASANQNQNQNQTSPNGEETPTPLAKTEGNSGEETGANGDMVFSVPKDIWRDFKEHRAKLKAPMTKRAEAMMLKDLEALHARGHDPTAVLEQSIIRGWKGVFELKGDRNGNGYRGGSGNGLLDACTE